MPSPHNNRTLRWDVEPATVEEELLRRERGQDSPLKYNVVVQLGDLGEAIRNGELASFAPEDLREFVRARRAEALAAQDDS